jgi:hypothetical protein
MTNSPFRPIVEQLGSLNAAIARSPTSNNNFAPMAPHIWPSMTVSRISIRLQPGVSDANRELFYYGSIAQMERYLRELSYVSASE